MDEAERQRQVDDAYRAIGRYVVTFSQMFAFMRQTMGHRLMQPGDGVKLVELVLADANAYQIANSFFAICNAVGNFDATEKRIAKWLRNRVLERIEERNRIAHGDWHQGATHVTASQEQLAVSILITTRAARDPSRSVQLVTAAQLDEWATSLGQLGLLVAEFGQIALNVYPHAESGTVRVSDVFVIKGKKREEIVLREGPKAEDVQLG